MSEIIEKAGKELEEAIKEYGEVLEGNMLKVDKVLNHQIRTSLINRIGAAFAEEYSGYRIDKVLTAEAAGISIAYTTAVHLNEKNGEREGDHEINLIYAKKGVPETMNNEATYPLSSPTKGNNTTLAVEKNYLDGNNCLLVDDFLFKGNTSETLTKIAGDSNAEIVAYGFGIEKMGHGGRETLERYGKPILSLVKIESMDPETGKINFV